VFDPSNPAALSPAEPSIKLCPNGTWTLDVAAIDVRQCCELPLFLSMQQLL
jgi:hypothetical protein